MSIDIDGLDKLQEKLEKIENLGGEVPFNELFTPEFMRLYTEYNNIEEFLEDSKWEIENQEDFESIPEDEFDKYVEEKTDFSSWEIMLQTAGKKYIEKEISNI